MMTKEAKAKLEEMHKDLVKKAFVGTALKALGAYMTLNDLAESTRKMTRLASKQQGMVRQFAGPTM